MKAWWTLSLPQTSRANPVQCCSTHQKKCRFVQLWMCLFRCKGGWVGRKLQRELFRKWDHWRPQVRGIKVMTTTESESVRKRSERVIPSRGETHCSGWGETVLPHILKLESCSTSRHFLYSSWSMSVVALCALVFSVSHCARILITS